MAKMDQLKELATAQNTFGIWRLFAKTTLMNSTF